MRSRTLDNRAKVLLAVLLGQVAAVLLARLVLYQPLLAFALAYLQAGSFDTFLARLEPASAGLSP